MLFERTISLLNARRVLRRNIRFLHLLGALCRLDNRLFHLLRLYGIVCYTLSFESNHHNLVIACFLFHLAIFQAYIDAWLLLGVFFIVYKAIWRNVGLG